MKKIILLCLFFLLALIVKSQSLFDNAVLHEIRINSDDANLWNSLEHDYFIFYPDVPYTTVTVTVDGTVLEQVGVRQKGFSSNFFTITNKKPLKINFGKFVDGQKYDGVKKLNLANGIGDPAIVKDRLAYDMFRQHGIAGPRVANAKVYINDQYWGIYAMIEQIDKRYLKRNFADKTGNLWKNKDNSTLSWQGTNPANYTFELQTNEDENDFTKFIEFVDFINNTTDTDFENGIESIFDLDEYLRILAIDILTNNWDSYIEHGRNWYLYYEPKTDKMHWLPWDYNFAFDRSTNGFEDFSILLNNFEKVLVRRILNVQDFRVRYLNYMCEILEVNFTNTRLNPLLDNQINLLENDWSLANNNFFSLNDVQNAINGNTWFSPVTNGAVQGLKKFIEDRAVTMANDIANLGYTCTSIGMPINNQDVVINEFMANNLDESQWFDQDNENDDWVELYNNTNQEISLKNYFLSDSQSFIHKWEFPEDATIPANGYLIVWADKDPQQAGLHTKFNLDKNGDELFLSYLDGTIIDSVDFPEDQAENKSLSRIPNGTGDFVVADVTYNGMNTNNSANIADLVSKGITMYPNPVINKLKIDFNNTIASKISINDLLGRKVYTINNNTNNLEIDVSSWNKGVYLVKLTSNKYTVFSKVIVE